MSKDAQNQDSVITDNASFEELVARLEQVVSELEGGDLPLSRSLAVFEEGVRLSRLGASRLDEAERRVEELLANEDPNQPVQTRTLSADDPS